MTCIDNLFTSILYSIKIEVLNKPTTKNSKVKINWITISVILNNLLSLSLFQYSLSF